MVRLPEGRDKAGEARPGELSWPRGKGAGLLLLARGGRGALLIIIIRPLTHPRIRSPLIIVISRLVIISIRHSVIISTRPPVIIVIGLTTRATKTFP